jgi:hypothetical protein
VNRSAKLFVKCRARSVGRSGADAKPNDAPPSGAAQAMRAVFLLKHHALHLDCGV